jgi:uncharacterized DUF497 family protein
MRFEWDRRKAQVNWLKHRTLFEEASTVFADPLSSTIVDPDHSIGEYRFLTLGVSSMHRLLVVCHTDRDDECIRIISARPANRHEKTRYQN